MIDMDARPAQTAEDALVRVLGMCIGELSAAIGTTKARKIVTAIAENDEIWTAFPAIRRGSIIGADEALRTEADGEE